MGNETRYINKGVSKFGAISIEKIPEGDKSSLSYRLFVDGIETWNTTITSPERKVPGGNVGGFWERITGSL